MLDASQREELCVH